MKLRQFTADFPVATLAFSELVFLSNFQESWPNAFGNNPLDK